MCIKCSFTKRTSRFEAQGLKRLETLKTYQKGQGPLDVPPKASKESLWKETPRSYMYFERRAEG